MSRSTRASSRRKKPNAALYVGYVEDDETPDMIMKKFEMMERMAEANRQAKAQANAGKKSSKSSKAEMSDSDEEEQGGDQGLTEEQLVSLFQDTSYYSVNSLQRNNEIMFQKQTVDEDGFVIGIDDPNYHNLMFEVDYTADADMVKWVGQEEDDYIGEEGFWDDDDDDDTDKTGKSTTRRTRKSRGMAVKRDRFTRFAGHAVGSTSLHRGGDDAAAGGGKVKLLCHEPFYLKVPAYPIPRSWLKPIAHLDSRSLEDYKGYHYVERDILSMRSAKDFFFANNAEKVYRAVLMDPPFDLSESPVHIDDDTKDKSGLVSLDEFKSIPMGRVVPDNEGAMLFIWVPSELTMQVNEICESWGFLLVEHATWILRNLSWQIMNRESNLTGISKSNLLLFRRTKKNGKSYNKLELRHQRTSDSYFDYVRIHEETGRELKSDYHYKVIETMLPDLDKKEKGQALFLWAPKNERRDGWTCVCDTKLLEMLKRNKEDSDIGDW